MISGGSVTGNGFSTSTLFNWLSQEQCTLPDLPYDVAGQSLTSAFGVPLFCGGSFPATGSSRKACYKFNVNTKGWDQV